MMMKSNVLKAAAVVGAAVLCPPVSGVITVGGMIAAADGAIRIVKALDQFEPCGEEEAGIDGGDSSV